MLSRRLARYLWLLLVLLLHAGGGRVCAAAPVANFALPSGPAHDALKLAAQQGNVEVLISTEVPVSATTRAVYGRFTPGEALARMLEGTPFVAVPVSGGKAFGILRKPPQPASRGVGEIKTSDPPSDSHSSMKNQPKRARQNPLSAALSAVAAFAFGTSAPLAAQEQASGSVITLSPFEVDASRDLGYFSANAYSAYRLNIPIAEIPFTINVVNAEFIADLQATTLEDIAFYTPGVSRPVENNNIQDSATFTIRGIGQSRAKRNGFNRYYATDTTNIDRVEIVKGPASAMYGSAEPGGLINYVTKRATSSPTHSAQLTVGSWDYYRAQIGTSGPLGSKALLYRIDASYLDRGGYRDWEYELRSFASGLLEWRPNDRVMIRADVEWTHRDFNPVARNLVWNPEAFAVWDALPAAQKFSNAQLSGVPLDPATGTRLWTEVAPQYPLTLNAAGPDAYNRTEVLVGTVESQIHLSRAWSARGMVSQGRSTIDNLMASANRILRTGDGLNRSHRSYYNENTTLSGVADVAGDFRAWGAGHKVVFGAEYFEDKFYSTVAQQVGASQVLYLNPSSVAILPTNNPNAEIRNFGLRPQGPASVSESSQETTGVFASYQLSMLEGRMRFLGGVRYDENEAFNASGAPSRPALRQTSPQLGVTFRVLPSVVAFANYSESFIPQGGLFRNPPPAGGRLEDTTTEPRRPQVGEGYDFGIKFDSPGAKFSGTLSVFSIKRQNVVVPLVIFPDGESVPATSFRVDRYIDGETSDGFEASMIITPRSNWQIMAGYSYLDAKKKDPAIVGTPFEAFLNSVEGVPDHQVSLWTKYSFRGDGNGFSLGGGYVYMGERRGGPLLDDYIMLDAFHRVDAFVQYAWRPSSQGRASLRLNVENLFDERYFRPGPLVENPTNVKMTVRYAF